ncbi:unnamed protein product, partial [Staurois parvus]
MTDARWFSHSGRMMSSYDVLPFSPRMRGSGSAQRGDRRCAVSLGHSGSPIHGKSRRCLLGYVISCVQSQLITCKQGNASYLCPDDQCSPSSATCQCPSVPCVSAHPCHLPVPISATSMPHISAHLSCLSVSPINANQCHLSVLPISATNQCQSVPPISVHQCHLSVLPNS